MLPEAANSCGAALSAQSVPYDGRAWRESCPCPRSNAMGRAVRIARARAHCTPFGKMGAGLRGTGEFPSRAQKAPVFEVDTQHL